MSDTGETPGGREAVRHGPHERSRADRRVDRGSVLAGRHALRWDGTATWRSPVPVARRSYEHADVLLEPLHWAPEGTRHAGPDAASGRPPAAPYRAGGRIAARRDL